MLTLKCSYYALRRMLRNYIGMVILLLTPIALITVLGLIAGGAISPQTGIDYRAEIAIIMLLNFQVFGGFVMMEYMREDFMDARKWRIRSLPYHAFQHSLSTLIASVLFNVLQGLIILIFTQMVYGVDWGNYALVILTLILVSTLSQLIFTLILLSVKKYKTAETLGTSFGMLMLVLAETWFPLPEGIFFEILSTYGNLISLGRNMMVTAMTGENIARAVNSLVVLMVAIIITLLLAKIMGRKKLA